MVAVQFGTIGDTEPGRERKFPIEILRLDMSSRFDQEDGTSRLERGGSYFLFNFRLMTAFLRESKELRVLGPLEAPWKSALSS